MNNSDSFSGFLFLKQRVRLLASACVFGLFVASASAQQIGITEHPLVDTPREPRAASARSAQPIGITGEISITGGVNSALAPFDQAIVSVMKQYGIPGAQLAVTQNGRLVLAHGYGWADSGNNVTVQPDSRFRIASLSKQLTSIAVLQLVQQGKLSLDDHPFAILAALQPLPGAVEDPRLATITIRNLLQHTGGWDSSMPAPNGYDPMFDSLNIAVAVGVLSPPSTRDIIRYMLGRPLDFTPGTRYAYSNFGYAVLGRVIEAITGVTYEQYVLSNVLAPVGVTDMQIGQTLTAGRLPGEASYYMEPGDAWGQSVFASFPGNLPVPYGDFYLGAMDSPGGWLASAIDLLKFWNGIDGRRGNALLTPASLQLMTAPPQPSVPQWANTSYWYGMGFYIGGTSGSPPTTGGNCPWPPPLTATPPATPAGSWFHDGSLPGTRTWAMRTDDGYAWAALFNERMDAGDCDRQLVFDTDNELLTAAAAVTSWPTTDLFTSYPSATVTLGSLVAIYNGTPKPATATTNPAGLAVTLTYNGSSTAPTAVGSYAVVATISDPNYTGSASSATGTLVISQTNPPGTLVPAPGSPFAVGTDPVSVAVGDFNGDGIQDLAIANFESNSVTVLLGKGSGGFTTPGATFAVGHGPSSVAVGDFNGDGIPDLAVANDDDNNVAVLLGNGSGGFTTPGATFAVLNGPFSQSPSPFFVAVGDFNGDGIADLAVANSGTNNVAVLLGNGLGGFTMAPGSPFAVGTDPISVAVGDFDGDGIPDLAVANFVSNSVTVLLGNGSGGFAAAPVIPFPPGSNPSSVAVGDFNGDGQLDLAVTNPTLNVIAVLLGDGSGGFTAVAGSPFAGGTNPFSVAVGDFNGDGYPDLAVANSGSNNVTVLLNNGLGRFTAAPGSPFAAGSGPWSVAVGDFNGDGKPDLAVANSGASNNVTVLLGAGAAPATLIQFETSPAGLPVSVDGGPYINTPTDALLAAGSHTIAVFPTWALSFGQYVFSSWSDGGAISHSIRVENDLPATYTATYNLQYALTTASSPPTGGVVSPASGTYYNAGSVVSVQATANAGYKFANFSGGLTGSANPQTITMNGPANVVANFTKLAPSLAASVGARTDVVPGVTREVIITLTNTGAGPATNATITSITGISVVLGSGSVSVAPGLPIDGGTIPASGAVPFGVIFNWPSTATKVKFIVNFTADNGYTGATTITTLR